MGIDPKAIDWDSLGFNLTETRSMYKAVCKREGSWSTGGLIPFGNIELSPAAGVLNYGQGVFEGMKAYRTIKNRIVIFRPDMNAKRISMSSQRLCMPAMDKNLFLRAVLATVKDNLDYIPPNGKGSLYLRPVVWGTAPVLGVKPVDEYTFIVYASPVGPYFKGDIKPLNLHVTNDYHRAAPKGIGNVKAIGNYSASLLPLIKAKNEGYDEVIYLNAGDEELIEEAGAANMFIIKDNVLKTPKLAGSILPGVTRDSVLTLARAILEIDVQETDVTLNEVCTADEVFCTGTAVVVTPVGKIASDNKEYIINGEKIGKITNELRSLLIGIQREEREDTFNWLQSVD